MREIHPEQSTVADSTLFSTPLSLTGAWHYDLVSARTVQGGEPPAPAVLLQSFTIERHEPILRIYEIGTRLTFRARADGPTQWAHQSGRLIAPAGVRTTFYRKHQPSEREAPSVVCIPEISGTPPAAQGWTMTGFTVETVAVTVCSDGFTYDGDVRGKCEDVSRHGK